MKRDQVCLNCWLLLLLWRLVSYQNEEPKNNWNDCGLLRNIGSFGISNLREVGRSGKIEIGAWWIEMKYGPQKFSVGAEINFLKKFGQ